MPNYSSPQPLQSNPDVLLLPLDPQITTLASFCRQKCLPGPTEIVQNEIASLAERLDQLLGKPQWEDRRGIKTRLQGPGTNEAIIDYGKERGWEFLQLLGFTRRRGLCKAT